MTGTGSPAPNITFLYSSDRNRVQQNHSVNGVTTYVYAGSAILYERLVKSTTTTNTHYLYAGGLNFGVFVTKTGAANDTRYFHRDHLGSVDAVTNAAGSVIERMSFDAWGARRNNDWTDPTGVITVTSTLRGFTGHEMLDALGLIHMNGRVYNPTLGRFVSADIYIQFPANLQSFNRYTYVLNNPLSFTDPTGHFIGFEAFFVNAILSYLTSQITRPLLELLPGPLRTILAIIVGFYAGGGVNGAADWGEAAFGGFAASLVSSGGDYRQAIIGAATAAAFYNVGEGTIGGAIKKIPSDAGQWLAHSVAHGVVGGVSSVIQGDSFLSGFASAGTSSALAPGIGLLDSEGCPAGSCVSPIRVAVSAGVGGLASVLGGGKFGNGALTGAFSRLFNEETARLQALAEAEFQSRIKQLVAEGPPSMKADYARYTGATKVFFQNTKMSGLGASYTDPDGYIHFSFAMQLQLTVSKELVPLGMILAHELRHAADLLGGSVIMQSTGRGYINFDPSNPNAYYGPSNERGTVQYEQETLGPYYGIQSPRTCYPCADWVPVK